jgi:hypothetical protein
MLLMHALFFISLFNIARSLITIAAGISKHWCQQWPSSSWKAMLSWCRLSSRSHCCSNKHYFQGSSHPLHFFLANTLQEGDKEWAHSQEWQSSWQIVLDFGCSSGWFTEWAHSQEWQSSWQIVACDSWLQM